MDLGRPQNFSLLTCPAFTGLFAVDRTALIKCFGGERALFKTDSEISEPDRFWSRSGFRCFTLRPFWSCKSGGIAGGVGLPKSSVFTVDFSQNPFCVSVSAICCRWWPKIDQIGPKLPKLDELSQRQNEGFESPVTSSNKLGHFRTKPDEFGHVVKFFEWAWCFIWKAKKRGTI